MIAVKAYYDGNAFIPFEKKSFKKNQQALIVIEETSISQKKCRGIASEYANPSLIEKESEIAAETFSGKGRFN